jgi:hypothetical protein
MSRAEGRAGSQREHLLHSRWDALLIGLSIALGAALLRYPSAPVIAVAVWWNANTIAHNFIHWPFFRGGHWNAAYSIYLSVLLGFPQSWWRDRHLAHHAGRPVRIHINGQLVTETILVLGLWGALIARADGFFQTTYLPGLIAGLGLCWLHGYFEHAGGTVSHYGPLYNALFLNDGYHVEHHREPETHWADLRRRPRAGIRASRWPAVLRWLEMADRSVIEQLERLALCSGALQRFLLRRHEAAIRRLLPRLGGTRTVTIVGGGMFPRTAILMRRLLPDAEVTIVDRNAKSIAIAKRFLDKHVAIEHRAYDGAYDDATDLLVIPLSYRGDRAAVYRDPPAPNVLVHDWIWAPRGKGVVVSWLLLKRINLIRRES